MQHFDAIVIGTGVAGQTAAAALAEGGLRVAAVDRREFGGTCALRGCEPKKVLFNAAEAVERVRDQSGMGVAGDARLDWQQLIRFKRTFTDPAPERIENWLTSRGVTTVHGEATFTAPDTVRIADREYRPAHVVVATGARPTPLRIPGAEFVIDSEEFMERDELRARLAFIGGGYISFEFAHIAAAAGRSVTILSRGPRVLDGFDADLAALLASGYTNSGITIRYDAGVTEVRRVGDSLEVLAGSGASTFADTVVHGAGRVPDLLALDLAAAGVETGARGVLVDDRMRSISNPRVFAIGDSAALGIPLTPVGIAQGHVAARAILGVEGPAFDGTVVPSVVFADPPLAMVGLREDEALARGLDVDVRLNDTSRWVASRRVGVRASGAKILVERGTDLILGAHLLGHGADEVINVLATAMRCGVTATEVREAMWAYPTAGHDLVDLL